MLTNIRPKDTDELYATPILQQTAFWSAVKSALGANTIAINFSSRRSDLFTTTDDRSSIISDVLIILQQMRKWLSVSRKLPGVQENRSTC